MSACQLHPSPGDVRPRLLREGDKVQSFVMEFFCTSALPSAVALSSRQACSLCKELSLFLRWIIPSTSDTSTFLVRLVKQILPQLVMNLMCCDSHKQGNKENPHMSADLSKTSISQHQKEQDVSPKVTVVISSHRNVWMQRLMCQVLLTRDSFEKSYSFVVWYCAFLAQRAGKDSRLSYILLQSALLPAGNIWWEKAASIPQVMHCKVSVYFTQYEGTLWSYRHWE